MRCGGRTGLEDVLVAKGEGLQLMRMVFLLEVEEKNQACCSGIKEDKGVVGIVQRDFGIGWDVSLRAFEGFCEHFTEPSQGFAVKKA
jgi:hypothetical protein